jgi:hypothetical protein
MFEVSSIPYIQIMYFPLFVIALLLAYYVVIVKHNENKNKNNTEIIVYATRSMTTATATGPMDPDAIKIHIQFTPKQIVHHRRITKTASMPNLHLGPSATAFAAVAAVAAAVPADSKKTQ